MSHPSMLPSSHFMLTVSLTLLPFLCSLPLSLFASASVTPRHSHLCICICQNRHRNKNKRYGYSKDTNISAVKQTQIHRETARNKHTLLYSYAYWHKHKYPSIVSMTQCFSHSQTITLSILLAFSLTHCHSFPL